MGLESENRQMGSSEKQEQLSSQESIIRDLERINEDLMKQLQEGIPERSADRSGRVRRNEAVKKIRSSLIQKHPGYDEFITTMTDSLQHGPEWAQLTTHLLVNLQDKPLVAQKLWEILQRLHDPTAFKIMKSGIVSQASAAQVFKKLGFPVRLATPSEDVSSSGWKGVDFFAGNFAIQVKSKRTRNRSPFWVSRKVSSHPSGKKFLEVRLSGSGADPYTGAPSDELVEAARSALRDVDWS